MLTLTLTLINLPDGILDNVEDNLTKHKKFKHKGFPSTTHIPQRLTFDCSKLPAKAVSQLLAMISATHIIVDRYDPDRKAL